MNKRKLPIRASSEDEELATESGTGTKRLRRRKDLEGGPHTNGLEIFDELSDHESEASSDEKPRASTFRTLSHISGCGPAFPRSHYQGWTPPLPPTTERKAIYELNEAFNQQCVLMNLQPEYTFFKLDNFSIYRPEHRTHAHQLS